MRHQYLLLALSVLLIAAFAGACVPTNNPPAAVPGYSAEVGHAFDVIVTGATPEGIAAAVAAARNGAETLLIDTENEVGGLITQAELNTLDMNYDPEGNVITKGIFWEFFKMNDKRTSLDVEAAKAAFRQLINQEKNLTVRLNVKSIQPLADGRNRITGIVYQPRAASTGNGTKPSKNSPNPEQGQGPQPVTVRTNHLIDATADASLAYEAGAQFTLGQSDFGGPPTGMAVTQVFEVSNIDWPKLKAALNGDDDPATGADDTSAWGFGDVMKGYQAKDPQIRLRGLNLGRQKNGTVLVNAMQIFGLNGLDPDALADAKQRAAKEMPSLIAYLRETIPGFANASVSGLAEKLYVRETRHLISLYRLGIDDVLENRNFPDKIALGSYPVDIQSTSPADWGLVVGNPATYSIPFRSLVPRQIDGLLVVGRSAGYDSLAAGSARVIPVGMNVGEAAGTAAAIAVKKRLTFHQMAASAAAIKTLQQRLVKNGAYLPEFHYESAIQNDPRYGLVKFFRSKGLIGGGYNNDYMLDDPIPAFRFDEYFVKLLSYFDHPLVPAASLKTSTPLQDLKGEHPALDMDTQPVTLGDVRRLARHLAQTAYIKALPGTVKQIWPDNLPDHNTITREEMYRWFQLLVTPAA